jgi:hypothetical protein
MMKKSKIIFGLGMIVFIFVNFLFANTPDTTWTKTYGTTEDESNGDFSIILTNVEDEDFSEEFLFVSQSGTNPFKERTKVLYGLTKLSKVRIVLYNSLGQEVKVLLNEKKNPGIHTTAWNGRDNSSNRVSSGVYLMRFEAEDFKITKKLLLIR